MCANCSKWYLSSTESGWKMLTPDKKPDPAAALNDLVLYERDSLRRGPKPTVLTDEVTNAILRDIARTNAVSLACLRQGVSPFTWAGRVAGDEILKAAVATARELHADLLRNEVYKRALEGVDEITEIRDGAGALLEQRTVTKKDGHQLNMMAKAHCEEFREKVQHDHRLNGGVLVVGSVSDIGTWLAENGSVVEEIEES